MKFNKTITYFVLLALAMALSSCNSYYDDDNTDNLTIKTIIGEVGVNSWEYSYENNNNYFIATIECFDDEGTYMFNIKEHYEKVKVVKYNHMLNPINTYTLPFHGIDSVKICIDFLSNKK